MEKKKRLTTDDPQNNLQTALNLFYAKAGQAWVRGGGHEFAYEDVPLFTYIRSIIKHLAIAPQMFEEMDNETLAEVLTEWLFDGYETKEGLVATLYTTAWAFAELRARLKDYEDTGLDPNGVKDLRCKSRWIGAEDPPQKGEYDWVLVQVKLIPEDVWGIPERAEYKNGVWRDIQGRPLNTKYEKVTHWRPLPAPPEEAS